MFFINPKEALIHNNCFKSTFAIGLLVLAAGFILSIVQASLVETCVDMNYCKRHFDSYDRTCVDDGSLYCCSKSKSGASTCGSYRNSCTYIDYGYSNCQGWWITQTVLGGIAMLCLVVLVILAVKQKKKTNNAWKLHMMSQHGIIFSDRIQPPPNAYQPPAPAMQYAVAQPIQFQPVQQGRPPVQIIPGHYPVVEREPMINRTHVEEEDLR